ncbi:ParA family protein [Virgibacillus siamensis]|uniref:ParA family protein n=1 Tax=Virgibacillus siamensis TaxID=480071 RepID=UPI0009874767|nr:ParA family protein [Virgibacillus siamensis]
MATIISLGLQKGGVGKSTTAGVLAHLLVRDGSKVLAIDMDSQGNLSELLTDLPSNDFVGKSVFEAIITKQPKDYIYEVNENLHLLPANNYLALFARWLYTKRIGTNDERLPYDGTPYEQVHIMLEEIKDDYDYVVIDTPPALSEQTTNALVASDYVITLFECSKFCYSAIPNFLDSIYAAQERKLNKVEPIGILRTLTDKRRTDAKMFNEIIAGDYPDLVFDTIISRKASTGRLSFYGFEDNHEINDALSQYEDFYKEVLNRMGVSKNE